MSTLPAAVAARKSAPPLALDPPPPSAMRAVRKAARTAPPLPARFRPTIGMVCANSATNREATKVLDAARALLAAIDRYEDGAFEAAVLVDLADAGLMPDGGPDELDGSSFSTLMEAVTDIAGARWVVTQFIGALSSTTLPTPEELTEYLDECNTRKAATASARPAGRRKPR